jgi:hypothetical protein
MSYKPDGRVPICLHCSRDYDICKVNVREIAMSMQNEGKDAKGRKYDQMTKDGTGSQHNDWGHSDVGSGNRQSGGRIDDLLSPAPDSEQRQGFVPGEEAGELQTGMGGIGSLSTGNAGSRQSEGESQPGGDKGSMQSGEKANATVPESGGQRTKQ